MDNIYSSEQPGMPGDVTDNILEPAFVKVSGYLERKVKKLTFIEHWKKCWCVLEGQLLLYYKSYLEYLKLSPCRGSLNMALVLCIQSYPPRRIEIHTHSQFIVLRAQNKVKQQQWFQALFQAMPQNIKLAFNCFTIDFPSCTVIRKKTIIRKPTRKSKSGKKSAAAVPTSERNSCLDDSCFDSDKENEINSIDVYPENLLLQQSSSEENGRASVDTADRTTADRQEVVEASTEENLVSSEPSDSTHFLELDAEIEDNWFFSVAEGNRSDYEFVSPSSSTSSSSPSSSFLAVNPIYRLKMYPDSLSKISERDETDHDETNNNGNNIGKAELSLLLTDYWKSNDGMPDWDQMIKEYSRAGASPSHSDAEIMENSCGKPQEKRTTAANGDICISTAEKANRSDKQAMPDAASLTSLIVEEEEKEEEEEQPIGNDIADDHDGDDNDKRLDAELAVTGDGTISSSAQRGRVEGQKLCIKNQITTEYIKNNYVAKSTLITNECNMDEEDRSGSCASEINSESCKFCCRKRTKSRDRSAKFTLTDSVRYSDVPEENASSSSANKHRRSDSPMKASSSESEQCNVKNNSDCPTASRAKRCRLFGRRIIFGRYSFCFWKKWFSRKRTPKKTADENMDTGKREFINEKRNFNNLAGDDGDKKDVPEPIANTAKPTITEDTNRYKRIRVEIVKSETSDDEFSAHLEDSLFENSNIDVNESALDTEIRKFFDDNTPSNSNDNTNETENNMYEANTGEENIVGQSVGSDSSTDPCEEPENSENIPNPSDIDNRYIDKARSDNNSDQRKEGVQTNSDDISCRMNDGKTNDQNEEVIIPILIHDDKSVSSLADSQQLSSIVSQSFHLRESDVDEIHPLERVFRGRDYVAEKDKENQGSIATLYCAQCQYKAVPPNLPIKRKYRISNRKLLSQQFPAENPCCKSNFNLDALLMQLLMMNGGNSADLKKVTKEYDYDIPRPHSSLIETINKQREHLDAISERSLENSTYKNACNSDDDDLRLSDSDLYHIAPDSLEQPWTLYQATNKNNLKVNDLWDEEFDSDGSKYPDSLNSVF